ncbi:MAG TPA: glycosyltransferase [Anditalea sp.]|nr:glycosyltransferase [Anditalea sp.]
MKTINSDKTLVYLAIVNKKLSPGVFNKIIGTVKGAEKNGFAARVWYREPNINFREELIEEIISATEKYVLIRSVCEYNIFLLPALIKAKRQGKVIIFDVPTPNRVAVYEIYNGDKTFLGKIKSLFFLLASGPIPYLFVDRIIQYAQEGKWFLLGNHAKTKLIGNGIDVSAIRQRNNKAVWPSSKLNLIAVASINYWHGFDRLIKAIKIFNDKPNVNYKVYLTIIGKGSYFQSLNNLVLELKLEDFIIFKGFLTGEDLYENYDIVHLGVGSLGLYRKKLDDASELKSREYCSIGLPFLASGNDPDFPESTPFRYKVENTDEIESIIDFLLHADDFLLHTQDMDIRKFAENKLDFKVKIREILDGL